MIDRALVLTAGLGTRLRPLTEVRAKPALPVAGEPMIRRIIAWLVSQGVRDLVLNLHHLPETLTARVGDGADLGARVRYSWEQPRVLGAAGGPRLARPILGDGTFLIVNGDTLTDVNLEALVRAHTSSDALVTMALVPNREFTRYGGVLLDGDRVAGFASPGPASEGSGHFIGVQVVNSAVLDAVPAGEFANSVGGIYNALITATPGAVRGYLCDAEFWDVGTVEDYWRTSHAFASRAAPPSSSAAHAAEVDPSARVTGSILWDDVVIEAGATVHQCIVTDGVRVASGESHGGAILLRSENGTLAVPMGFEI